MKISGRAGTALFFVALFSSFLMKYPLLLFKAHQGYWDSSFLLYFSKYISVHGSAPWIANWSSYFGLHRNSYPQGVPFLISVFQQLNGIFDPDSLVLVASYMEGFMAVLFGFALALTIRKKDYLFAFFVSFLFSTAPAYVQFTGWTVSGRGFIITLLPLYLLLNIFIFQKRISMRCLVFLNVFFLAVLFSIHRMAFFVLATAIPATVLTYFFTEKREYYAAWARSWHLMDGRKRYLAGGLLLSIFICIIYLFYTQYVMSVTISSAYTSSKTLSGNTFYIRLINLSFAFAGSGGLLVPFAALSLFYVLRDKMKNTEILYMIIFFTFSLFTIFYPLYFRPFESLILSLFIALSFMMYIYKRYTQTTKKSIINLKTITVMFVVAILFSTFMQIRWVEDSGYYSGDPKIPPKEEVVTTVKYLPEKMICVSTPPPTGRDIALLSDKIIIPANMYPYYLYTNWGFLNSRSLNLSFDPHTSWGGRLLLYSENLDFKNVLKKFHNLSTYRYIVVISEYRPTPNMPNVDGLNETYKIYNNSVYSIFYVNPDSEEISRTRIWF